MGRSSASCLKIIACGSDSADRDDVEAQAPENKASSDKRGWSFRKRSARHRVLSNTVISEAPSSGNKGSPELTTVSYEARDSPDVPEKASTIQWADEKPQLPALVDSKLSETLVASVDDNKVDETPDESFVIIIQAAIRGFLAHKDLLKHKNIVKLQAAVRGHLVRTHAVGTLRCVQAIIKMQALVRARHARRAVGGSADENQGEMYWKDNDSLKPSGKENSIEKLLSNRFARQLLESKPKSKSINIKCDLSKSDSSWKWLERWMSVSSLRTKESEKLDSIEGQLVPETMKCLDNQVETVISSEGHGESTDLIASTGEAAVPSESENNLVTDGSENFEFQAGQQIPTSGRHILEEPLAENVDSSNSIQKPSDVIPDQSKPSDLIPEQTKPPVLIEKSEPNSLSGKSEIEIEIEIEQPKHSMKRSASDHTETEGKRFAFGSRRASNPAFIAAHSKFEELTSTTNSAKSVSSSYQDEENDSFTYQDARNVSFTDEIFSARDGVRETGQIEKSIIHNSVSSHVGGSECGTELSISSTLDSPDRSEVGAPEFEQEAKDFEDGSINLKSPKGIDVETKGEATIPTSDLSESKHEDLNCAADEPNKAVIAVDSSESEQKQRENAYELQNELDSETGHNALKSSPEASPRSHITIPESHGTPSSQISVKAKKNKSERSVSNQKRKSFSAGKGSPSNPNHDSEARSSSEQLPKDAKTGKRRISIGSVKTENADQEPRDSSSSNSLPSYMQATESARAKALANSSPRSSPDLQDKDLYIKKRHSLPGANGRQGSPRIQRSMSQAKGNSTNSNERKWQR